MAAYQTVFNIRHSGQESGQALRLSERTHFWYVNRRHRQRPESGACGWETGCAPACFGPRHLSDPSPNLSYRILPAGTGWY